MDTYHTQVKEEAKAFYDEIAADFERDAGPFGGGSDKPNLSLWLDDNGLLAAFVDKKSQGWTKKDVTRINENSRHRIPYGDPHSNAFGAHYKDILFELKKLFKKG